jgi:hypothetical protein
LAIFGLGSAVAAGAGVVGGAVVAAVVVGVELDPPGMGAAFVPPQPAAANARVAKRKPVRSGRRERTGDRVTPNGP